MAILAQQVSSRFEHPGTTARARVVSLLPAWAVMGLWIALMPGAGGFDPEDWHPAGLVLLGLLTVAVVGTGRILPTNRMARWALLSFAAFTAFNLLSIAWAVAPGRSWEAANLLLTTL